MLYDGSPGAPVMDVLWDLAARRRDDVRHERDLHRGLHEGGCRARRRPRPVQAPRRSARPARRSRRRASSGSTSTSARDMAVLDVAAGPTCARRSSAACRWCRSTRASCRRARSAATVESWDPDGKPLIGEVGELVITEPMPSMPICFWGDADGERYRDAYFDMYPGHLAPRRLDRDHRPRHRDHLRPLRRDDQPRRHPHGHGRDLPRRAGASTRSSTRSWSTSGRWRRAGCRCSWSCARARAGRRADQADRHARARGLLAAPRPERGHRRRRDPAHAVGQGARAAGQADPRWAPTRRRPRAATRWQNPAALDFFVRWTADRR